MATIFMHELCVNGENGRIDQEATLAKFAELVAAYALTVDDQDARVSEAVSAVFDANKGTSITMPALQTLSLAHLKVGAAEHKDYSEKVAKYVRANAGDFRRDGKPFKIGKGKGGGVFRWADRKEDKEKEEKEYQEYLKKAAAEPKAPSAS